MKYDYECSNCKYRILDVIQGLKDKPKKKCPSCKKLKLERILLKAPMVSCTNITTVGQLAEQNTRKIGKYKLSEEKEKNKGVSNLYGTLTNKQKRNIAKMSVKQKEKYVMTGNGI